MRQRHLRQANPREYWRRRILDARIGLHWATEPDDIETVHDHINHALTQWQNAQAS